MKNRKKSTASR